MKTCNKYAGRESEYKREWYLKNRERILAGRKARYAANSEDMLAKNKVYRDSHKTQKAAGDKRYREKNKDVLVVKKKEYALNNKDAISARGRDYYVANDDASRFATESECELRATNLNNRPPEYNALLIGGLVLVAFLVFKEQGGKKR